MHIRILLPSLFAASLLTTAALAERTDHDEGAPQRGSAAVRERAVREVRLPEARQRLTVKEIAPAKTSEHKAAPDKLAAKRGCATDDGNGCSSSSRHSDTKTSTKTTTSSAPAMPNKLQTQRGCATDDGNGCTSSRRDSKSKPDGDKKGVGPQHVVQTDRMSPVAQEIMKMRAEVEAKRILDMLKLKSCARNGSCGETPDDM